TVGTDSSTTPEIIYHVETPNNSIPSESAAQNVSSTSAKKETTTSNISISTPEIIHFKTQTTTSIIYWSESYVTTYSTETQYIVQSGSTSIPNIVYHMKTPDVSAVSSSVKSSTVSTTTVTIKSELQKSSPSVSTQPTTTVSIITSTTKATTQLVQYPTSSISSVPYTPQSMKIFSDSANKFVSTPFNFVLLFSMIFLI
ncbi:hypothetical protein C6P45_002463, partial [Maudiozyma exigua]